MHARAAGPGAARSAPWPGDRRSAVGDDLLALLAQPGDAEAHRIPRLEEALRFHAEPDTGRCSRGHDVARQQGHEMADVADDVRAREDHVLGRAALHALAADLAEEIECLRIGPLVRDARPP